MGFDAFVKCNCFKEGNIKSRPPFEEFVKEDESGLWLDLDWESNKEKHEIFDSWKKDKACIHHEMEFLTERLSNISGMANFKSLLANQPHDKYPILRNHLPESNDGSLSAELAEKMKLELESLLQETSSEFNYIIKPLIRLTKASQITKNPIVWC